MKVTFEHNKIIANFTSRSGDFAGITVTISQDTYESRTTGIIQFGPLFIQIGGQGLPRTYIKSAFLECFYEARRDDAETILENLFESIDLAESVQGHD